MDISYWKWSVYQICHTAVLFYHALAPRLLSGRLFDMRGLQCGSWSKGWIDRIGSEQVSKGHGEEGQAMGMQLYAMPIHTLRMRHASHYKTVSRLSLHVILRLLPTARATWPSLLRRCWSVSSASIVISRLEFRPVRTGSWDVGENPPRQCCEGAVDVSEL